jgi:hypothetical protein
LTYPSATEADVRFFSEHGWIQVDGALDPSDLRQLITRCQEIFDKRETMARSFDWAWERGAGSTERELRPVESSPTEQYPELSDSPVRAWAQTYASALMASDVEFWYDRFVASPPVREASTLWHQDEGYWGRNLSDRGITCWLPFHDVDEANGCPQFVDGGHKDGVLPHHRAGRLAGDQLQCEPDESRALARPLTAGAVTFHHSKTPHTNAANRSTEWSRILNLHFRRAGSEGEGDHYPWKVLVDQFTG